MSMWTLHAVLLIAFVLSANPNAVPPAQSAAAPIALHSDNPHYFVWRGQPTILITSGEHYGAVMNLDFDYRTYLDTLAADGLNYTRVFSGAYVEPQGAFNIARNTLAPPAGRFLAPWSRTTQPGYQGGGNKFDLAAWSPEYFTRLKGLVAYASTKGVVVEITLFCPMYEEVQWTLSPMNASNNVNGVGAVARNDVYTLDKNGGLLNVQEALTRKIVTELNGFDNVFYEICNEPYFGGVTTPWQHRIADVIVDTEQQLPSKHLIAQNIANKSATVTAPHPSVSIFNFHYASPPETVRLNYGLNKVIGDDETGFAGTSDATYRGEAWDFVIAGGALFNNLDYSFVAGQEDGSFTYPASQPGGGSAALRRQLKILKDFISAFDFVRMTPDDSVIAGSAPSGGSARALVEPGRAMAIYLRKTAPSGKLGNKVPVTVAAPLSTHLQLALPEGEWEAEWLDTKSGSVVGRERVTGGATRTLSSPVYDEDIALRLRKAQPGK